MRWVNEIDKFLRDMPARRRVMILQRALMFAKSDVREQEKFWKQLARQDEDTPADV